jgi:hypothetical protein
MAIHSNLRLLIAEHITDLQAEFEGAVLLDLAGV